MGKIAVIVVLIGLLVAAIWLAVSEWVSLAGVAMPTSGIVAMVLGIVFSLAVGIGLMALIFYSSRRGYDEPAQELDPPSDADRPQP